MKISRRTCIGCRAREEKSLLARIARTDDILLVELPDGSCLPRGMRKATSGRGAYVHPRLTCWMKVAANDRSLIKALRIDSRGAWFKRSVATLGNEMMVWLTAEGGA